jgi:hypothetical protein
LNSTLAPSMFGTPCRQAHGIGYGTLRDNKQLSGAFLA